MYYFKYYEQKVLFVVVFIVMVIPVFADYNISCEIDCVDYGTGTCSDTVVNYLEYWVGEVGNPYYDFLNSSEPDFDNNWSWRTSPLTVPDITGREFYGDSAYFSECNISEDIDWSLEGDDSTSCYTTFSANYSVRVLNHSDITWNDSEWEFCTNGTLDNDDCFESGEVVDFQIVHLDSVDGSCSGNVISVIGGDGTGCNYAEEYVGVYDKRYSYKRIGFVENDGCYREEDTEWCVAGGCEAWYPYTDWEIDCEVACDGGTYSFLHEKAVWDDFGGQYPLCVDLTQYGWENFTDRESYYSECVDFSSFCLEFSEPYNDTFTYGCECPPFEEDLGLFCNGVECYRSCSGDLEDNPLYVPVPYNETLEGVFEGGDASEVIGYFGSESTDFLGGWMDEYVSLAFYFIIIIAVLSVIGIIVALVKGK